MLLFYVISNLLIFNSIANLSIEDIKFLRRNSMGFTGIGLDGEYIEKPEDKNDESEDEEVENEIIKKIGL